MKNRSYMWGSTAVSTPERFTDNSMITPNQCVSTKNTSVRKSLCQFTNTLDVKHKTDVWMFGANKAKCKSIKKAMCCGKTLQIFEVIQK